MKTILFKIGKRFSNLFKMLITYEKPESLMTVDEYIAHVQNRKQELSHRAAAWRGAGLLPTKPQTKYKF